MRRATIAIDLGVPAPESAHMVAISLRKILGNLGFPDLEVTVLDSGFPPAPAGGQAQVEGGMDETTDR